MSPSGASAPVRDGRSAVATVQGTNCIDDASGMPLTRTVGRGHRSPELDGVGPHPKRTRRRGGRSSGVSVPDTTSIFAAALWGDLTARSTWKSKE